MEKGPSLKEVSILQGWRCNSETVESEGTRGVQPDRECLNNIVPQPDPAVFSMTLRNVNREILKNKCQLIANLVNNLKIRR